MRPTATREIPTGTVTFLFTDIVGSTELWETQPEAMRSALARHDRIVLDTARSCDGYVFTNAGDSWGIAFADPRRALACAENIRKAIEGTNFEGIGTLSIRIGIDTGLCDERDGDYFGPPLNRIHRMLARRRGAETILTATTADLVSHDLPDGRMLVDLGSHRLDGIPGRHRLYRLADLEPRAAWKSPWVLAAFPAVVLLTALVGFLIRDDGSAAPEETAPPQTSTPVEPPAIPTGEMLWTASTPGGYRAVTVGGIRVFATDEDGRLVALDLTTGSVLWHTDPVDEITGPPLLFGDVVLVTDQRTRLVSAYDAVTGDLAYRCASQLPDISPPAAGDNRIFVVAGQTPQVTEFRPRSPTPETCRQVTGATTFIRSFGKIEDPPILWEDRLLVTDAFETVHAFDTEDLSSGDLWAYDVPYESEVDPTLIDVTVMQPVLLDFRVPTESGWLEDRTLVMIGERRARGESTTWKLHRTDLASGSERSEILDVGGPPAAGLGRVFVASADNTALLVFDQSMTLEESLPVAAGEAAPRLDVDSGEIYVATGDGALAAIDAETLSVRWTVPVDGDVASVSSSTGIVVVRHADGELRAYAGSD